MSQINIPDSIKVGMHTYSVSIEKVMNGEGRYGSCHPPNSEIKIDPTVSDTQKIDTFIHEVLHACCNFTGTCAEDKFTEEEWVSRVAPILSTVLTENDFISNDPRPEVVNDSI